MNEAQGGLGMRDENRSHQFDMIRFLTEQTIEEIVGSIQWIDEQDTRVLHANENNEDTLRALELAQLDTAAELQVADIGCGTGASTLIPASRLLNARITAVDLIPEFLDMLSEQAREAGCSERIVTLAESVDSLPFAAGSLDLIWSEGATYNMGFSTGLEAWRPFPRPGGVIAVSEITWLHPGPPIEIRPTGLTTTMSLSSVEYRRFSTVTRVWRKRPRLSRENAWNKIYTSAI